MTFAESFIQDFESDFVLSTGEIVDNPDERWSRLTALYKEALKERDCQKITLFDDRCRVVDVPNLVQDLKDKINKIISLDAEDYNDGEVIDMIAKLTNYK